ncbi:MAG: ABC transporter permease, partial [Clostridiales bacterium]|nr:ABC transporter permease [Clostridiales bacterium]
YLEYSKDDYYQNPYDYVLTLRGQTTYIDFINASSGQNGYNENQKYQLKNSPYVKDINGSKSCTALLSVDEYDDYFTVIEKFQYFGVYENTYNESGITAENFKEKSLNFSDTYYEVKQKYGYENEIVPTSMVSFESSVLEKLENYVIDGKIDIDKIDSGEEIILYAPKNIAYYQDDNSSWIKTDDEIDYESCWLSGELSLKAGDTIDLSVLITDDYLDEDNEELPDNYEKNEKTVTIGAIISELPDAFYEETFMLPEKFGIFTSTSGFNKYYQDAKYEMLNINIDCECTDEIDDEMLSLLDSIGSTTQLSYVYSNYENEQESLQYKNLLLVSLISIIILFLAISASIINNSLTAKIRESKREIGTLRAVGATRRDLVSTYIRQLLSMFGWGFGIGFAGFGISYMAVAIISGIKSKSTDYSSLLEFDITLWQTILACLILFLICSVNLFFKIKKEMKNSIIDNIREL